MAGKIEVRKLAAVLISDVVGYSRRMGRDDVGTLRDLKGVRRDIVEPAILKYRGRVVRQMGDGTLAEFPSAVDCVRSALEIQTRLAERNLEVSREHTVDLRIGINVGDIISDRKDIHGDSVNIAARLELLADPGSVLVSGTVYDHVKNKLDADFRSLGEQRLKNIADPVRVYEVALTTSPRATVPDALLSFSSFDDRYHDGAIGKLTGQLAIAVQAVTGESFSLRAHADGGGLEYLKRISVDRAPDRLPLLIPILTPNLLRAPKCRAEIEQFLELEAKTEHDDLLIPIHYVSCPQLTDEELRTADGLAVMLHQRTSHDWRSLRGRRPSSRLVREALEALAGEIGRMRSWALSEAVASQVADALRVVETPALTGPPGEHPAIVAAPVRSEPPIPAPSIERSSPPAARSVSTGWTIERLPSGSVFRDVDEVWCPELVLLPQGEFMMGASGDDPDASDFERPCHRVRIGYPLAIGRFPVTFEEYDHFAESVGIPPPGDEGWGRGRRPVIKVSWHDALDYVAWLTRTTGQRYRLVHEAEWEYACRAGSQTWFWCGREIKSEQANFGLTLGRTSEVGMCQGNPWGLYDMSGNVWEWVQDWWSETYSGAPSDGSAREDGDPGRRVVRGGSWNNRPRCLRSAFRGTGLSQQPQQRHRLPRRPARVALARRGVPPPAAFEADLSICRARVWHPLQLLARSGRSSGRILLSKVLHGSAQAVDSKWSERPDSNRRPPVPQTDALPGCATLRPVIGHRYSGPPAARQRPHSAAARSAARRAISSSRS